jgi:hypothetical protein
MRISDCGFENGDSRQAAINSIRPAEKLFGCAGESYSFSPGS